LMLPRFALVANRIAGVGTTPLLVSDGFHVARARRSAWFARAGICGVVAFWRDLRLHRRFVGRWRSISRAGTAICVALVASVGNAASERIVLRSLRGVCHSVSPESDSPQERRAAFVLTGITGCAPALRTILNAQQSAMDHRRCWLGLGCGCPPGAIGGIVLGGRP
jgi:hypothetical protein